MSEIIKIIAVAIVTIFAHIIVRNTNKEIAMIITVVGSILIVFMIFKALSEVFRTFFNIFEATNLSSSLLMPLLKVIAIGYVAEFGANLCIDAGVSSIADKILFGAKILILMIALPIIRSVVDLVVALL